MNLYNQRNTFETFTKVITMQLVFILRVKNTTDKMQPRENTNIEPERGSTIMAVF